MAEKEPATREYRESFIHSFERIPGMNVNRENVSGSNGHIYVARVSFLPFESIAMRGLERGVALSVLFRELSTKEGKRVAMDLPERFDERPKDIHEARGIIGLYNFCTEWGRRYGEFLDHIKIDEKPYERFLLRD